MDVSKERERGKERNREEIYILLQPKYHYPPHPACALCTRQAVCAGWFPSWMHLLRLPDLFTYLRTKYFGVGTTQARFPILCFPILSHPVPGPMTQSPTSKSRKARKARKARKLLSSRSN
jgi:hypothetical protein